MRTSASRSRLAGGFTLIELLVVVGIIGLLMAILLPALGRARAEAQKIVCGSQMRQWGSGWVQFAGDYNEQFPDNNGWPGLTGTDGPYWRGPLNMHHLIQDYVYNDTFDVWDIRNGGTHIVFCPTNEQDRAWAWFPGTPHTSNQSGYRMGYATFPGRGSNHGPNREVINRDDFWDWVTKRRMDGPFSAAPIQADVYRATNEEGTDITDSENRVYSNHAHPRDRTTIMGGNYLYEDGSVRWHNVDEIDDTLDEINDQDTPETGYWFATLPIAGLAYED